MTNQQTNQIKELPYGTILKHIKDGTFVEAKCMVSEKRFRTSRDFIYNIDEYVIVENKDEEIKELNFIEKDALIRNSPIDAYYKLVSNENYSYYSDAMEIAEASMIELNGCHSTKQHLIAVKYVLLQMLRKNLI